MNILLISSKPKTMQTNNVIQFSQYEEKLKHSKTQELLTEHLEKISNIQEWQKPHLLENNKIERIVTLAKEHSNHIIQCCEIELHSPSQTAPYSRESEDKLISSAVKFLAENKENIFPLLQQITTKDISDKIKETLHKVAII